MAPQSLSTLLQQSSIDDHGEILSACDAALKTSKHDLTAQQTRIVALLKLDRYKDALDALDDGGDELKALARLERAYALYKTGELGQAVLIAKEASKGEDRGAQHVEAQASYRSEDFVTAAKIYGELASQLADSTDEVNDLRINGTAADAQLVWSGRSDLMQHKKPTREDLEAFETAYNTACKSIARGELAQGEMLLKRAASLCVALEELSEKEKQAEILPINVQLLFVLTQQGKTKEAEDVASKLSGQEVPDYSTRKIAQNNVLTSKSSSNPFIDYRILETGPSIPKSDQLFTYQSDKLNENTLSLSLKAQKPSGVIKATETQLKEKQPTTSAHINRLSVINAAAHGQGELAKAGLRSILPLFKKRPADIGLAMTIIQLYILTNNHGAAINVLERLTGELAASTSNQAKRALYSPGIIALQVSLYNTQDRRSQSRSALAKAAAYWRTHRSKPPPINLLLTAGSSLIDSAKLSDRQLARSTFKTLRDNEPTQLARAGFIATHAVPRLRSQITDTDVSSLPPISAQISGIDTNALEEAGLASKPTPRVSAKSRKRPADTAESTAKKKSKPTTETRIKSASRFPRPLREAMAANNGIRPANFPAPDPERWLPLRERSYYKPPSKKKGVKRQRGGAGAAQGGVERTQGAAGAETINNAAAPTTNAASGGGGGGQGPGQGGKKGKKKGGKR